MTLKLPRHANQGDWHHGNLFGSKVIQNDLIGNTSSALGNAGNNAIEIRVCNTVRHP